MPKFIYKADNHQGDSVVNRVEAETVALARVKLEALGYTNIRFQEEDFTADMDEQFEATLCYESDDLTAEEELNAQQSGFTGTAILIFKYHFFIIIPLAIWIGIALQEGKPYSLWDWSAFVCGGIFGLYLILIGLPSFAYFRSLHCREWAHWKQLLFWSQCMRLMPYVMKFESVRIEVEMARAKAHAALNNQEKAFVIAESLKQSIKTSSHFQYFNSLAGLYEILGDYETMLKTAEDALPLGKQSSTEYITLAHFHSVYLGNPDSAEYYLNLAKEKEIIEMGQSYLFLCEGAIALDRNQFAEAEAHFTKALQLASIYKDAPMMGGHIKEIKTLQLITQANQGRLNQARDEYKKLEPFWQAHNARYILDRCEKTFGHLNRS